MLTQRSKLPERRRRTSGVPGARRVRRGLRLNDDRRSSWTPSGYLCQSNRRIAVPDAKPQLLSQSDDPSRNTGIPIALARVHMSAVRASEDAVLVTHKPVLARRDVAIAVTHSADNPVSKGGEAESNRRDTVRAFD